jgi:Rrf2 family protein
MGLMQISRKADYALRAAIYLSLQSPEKTCSAGEIAAQQRVPQKFLEKIIRDLIRCGLVKSKRGWNGGYALARPPREISFRHVIEAVEGPIAVNLCMEPDQCCEHLRHCTMFGVWNEVQNRVLDVFTRTTLADLKTTPCPMSVTSSALSSAA